MMLLLVLTSVVVPSLGHEVLWGSCPQVKPVKDFDMERFAGLWYVLDKFDSDERCVTWNISRGPEEGTWTLLERKSSGLLSTVGLDQDVLHTATLTPDPTQPATMLVNWRLNIVGTYKMTVHTTDYRAFAGAFECQQVAFFQRQQGTVLSRKPSLPVDLRQMARLDTEEVLVEYYRPVQQGGCGYDTFSIFEGAGSHDHGPLGSPFGPSEDLDF